MKIILIILSLVLGTLPALATKGRWDANRANWSALMRAIYDGHTDTAIKYIQQDSNVNFIFCGPDSNMRLSALGVAIRMMNVTMVKALLGTNKIHEPGSYLMVAAGQQNASIVELLLGHGANPNDTLENGYSVLMMAASFGSKEVLESLLKHGADVNHTRRIDGMTPLMFAAFHGEPEKVKLLLQFGANKYIKDRNGTTALQLVDQIYEYLKVSEGTKSELRALLN